jgi:hypothetical protein
MSQRDELAAARDLPDGPRKMDELERVAAHADATGDLRLAFDARCALLETGHQVERWRVVDPFLWCRWAVDHYPATFDAADEAVLSMHHERAVLAMCASPRVGLAQAVGLLDDLDRRSPARGPGRRKVLRLRSQIADHLGDEPTARRWFAEWSAADEATDVAADAGAHTAAGANTAAGADPDPGADADAGATPGSGPDPGADAYAGTTPGSGPDPGADPAADCAACDRCRRADLLAGWGDWSAAVAVLQPVLAGELRCPAQPERALAAAMVPCLHLSLVTDAALAHVRAYQRHRAERNALPLLADHLRFCALAGHHERGLRILAEQLHRLDQPYDEAAAMRFAAAGALVCRLAEAGGLDAGTIHRPAYGERHAADLTVAALGRELVATARDYAGRFDARNATSHQSGLVAGWLLARPLCAAPALPDDEPATAADPDPSAGGPDL